MAEPGLLTTRKVLLGLSWRTRLRSFQLRRGKDLTSARGSVSFSNENCDGFPRIPESHVVILRRSRIFLDMT
jgi:hypothetical protein